MFMDKGWMGVGKSSSGARLVHTLLRNPYPPDKSNRSLPPLFSCSIAGDVDALKHPEGRTPRESWSTEPQSVLFFPTFTSLWKQESSNLLCVGCSELDVETNLGSGKLLNLSVITLTPPSPGCCESMYCPGR